MVYTSARPITVDGVRLDTLAWNVEKIERATAQRRSGDYDVPNLDGVVPSLNDALEPASFGLQMWLRGTDADGAVPGAGSLTTLRNNLDELLHLFGQRHKLLEIREQVDGGGTERVAWAKVTDSIAPELNTPGSAGRFSVAFILPSGQWEDVTLQDWVGAAGAGINNTAQTVTTLGGATDRVGDGVFLLKGPFTSPTITDIATGMGVTLNFSLAAGQSWRFNSETWSSRYGAGLTLASPDASGTDGAGLTSTVGPSRAYGLPLTPLRVSVADPTRRVQVKVNATAMAGTSELSIRAGRKYA